MNTEIAVFNIQDAINNQPKIGVIVGFYDHHNASGIQAHAVDARDGETMASHFCSGEGWAQSDLGFTIQGIPLGGSDINNQQRNEVYSHKYPDGYVVFWLGSAYKNDFNIEMLNKRDEFNMKLELERLIVEARKHKGTLDEAVEDLYKRFQVNPQKPRRTHTYEERHHLNSYANFKVDDEYIRE